MKKARFFTLLLPLVLRAEEPARSGWLVPDARGVLDVAGALQSDEGAPPANPFRSSRRPKPAIRRLTLAVSSVLVGAEPADASAIINGRAYGCGDRIEGLQILAITTGGIELADGRVRLRLPVDEPAPTLLLPEAAQASSDFSR